MYKYALQLKCVWLGFSIQTVYIGLVYRKHGCTDMTTGLVESKGHQAMMDIRGLREIKLIVLQGSVPCWVYQYGNKHYPNGRQNFNNSAMK